MELNAITRFLNGVNKNNPTLAFIHGNSMNAEFFRELIHSKDLSTYNSIAIDLPGHGESPKLDTYTIPVILDAIENELKGYISLILIGHSLGGHLSIQLLSRLKECCKAIVLIGTPPLKLPLNVEQAYNLNEHTAVLLNKELSESEISILADLVYPINDELKKDLKKSLNKTDGKFRQDFGISLAKGDINDEVEILNNFIGKKLLITGTDDSVVNVNYLKELESVDLPKSNFHFLQGIGHCPHLEEPSKVAQLINNFID